jgi:Amidohydrolase
MRMTTVPIITPMASPTAAPSAINASNRFGLDYAAEAGRFATLPYPIIDVHSHINGTWAVELFKRACDLYGVGTVYSMTNYPGVEAVRRIMEGRIRFIAVPDWNEKDRRHAHGKGFQERIRQFHAIGCRIVKFWAAPRGVDFAAESGDPTIMRLDHPPRVEAMRLASDLGMIFMTHVSDPDTWFATKYADAAKYGTKRQQYEPLERLLDQFRGPWIAAHLGGWPEDLAFLDSLLARHSNLYLDSSATKWIVREVSKHPRKEVVDFLTRWRGRVMFGSDIVTTDDHLIPKQGGTEMQNKASSEAEAFDLYVSRYWALRTLWETDHDGESPIADGDLAMVAPERHGPMDAPRLAGKALPPDVLRSLYHDAATALLEPLHRG